MQPNDFEYRGLMASTWDLLRGDTSRWEDRFFYLEMIEQYGQPALDVGCATGRLLLDYLQNGIDIDGVDISPEMLALCTEKASKMGLSPALYQQAMENLELPRSLPHHSGALQLISAHPRSRAGSAGNASPVCPPPARWGAGDAVHAPLAGRRSPGVRLGANERKGTTGRRSCGAQMVPLALLTHRHSLSIPKTDTRSAWTVSCWLLNTTGAPRQREITHKRKPCSSIAPPALLRSAC